MSFYHPDSSIQRMPPEVLGKIFSLTRPIKVYKWSPAAHKAPLLLCRVCSKWRAIAISTPCLWDSLKITIGEHAPTPRFPLIESFVSRARGRPLNFVLDGHGRWYGTDAVKEIVDRIQDIYVPRIAQWQHGNITIHSRTTGRPLPPISYGSAAMLKHLHMTVLFDSNDRAQQLESISHAVNVFGPAPGLRYLYLGAPRELLQHFLAVHWEFLEELYCPLEMTAYACFRIFMQCPSLDTCTADIGEHNPATDIPLQAFPPGQTIFPRLRDLGLVVNADITALLNAVTLPGLEVFSAMQSCEGEPPAPDPRPPWPHATFISLLERSSCRLTYLSLIHMPITDAELIECLRHMKDLDLLDVRTHEDETIITDEFLTAFTFSVDPFEEDLPSDTLCPRLTKLTLIEADISTTDGVLANMVESRYGVLQDIDLDVPLGNKKDIRYFRSEGAWKMPDRMAKRLERAARYVSDSDVESEDSE
ncbi:hypothetical protein PLICRDRAFT_365506 [Plicaturopsis crispa FD-325 SS-3]|uniref:F-box domain-containing protein n=1 Tax=Plicaturopsis crispa FD-325 SS-3 TaxID=944288 RepID=A0A0C9SKW3_PLICR|nr:hypothetical protein PLICRDRAFT_365506 [Plicaturopsis crispa FD-325 SS-3]